jgi:hypothetical protein
LRFFVDKNRIVVAVCLPAPRWGANARKAKALRAFFFDLSTTIGLLSQSVCLPRHGVQTHARHGESLGWLFLCRKQSDCCRSLSACPVIECKRTHGMAKALAFFFFFVNNNRIVVAVCLPAP